MKSSLQCRKAYDHIENVNQYRRCSYGRQDNPQQWCYPTNRRIFGCILKEYNKGIFLKIRIQIYWTRSDILIKKNKFNLISKKKLWGRWTFGKGLKKGFIYCFYIYYYVLYHTTVKTLITLSGLARSMQNEFITIQIS